MQRIKNVIPFLLICCIHINSAANEIDSVSIKVSTSDRQKLEELQLLDYFKEYQLTEKTLNTGMLKLYDAGYLASNFELSFIDSTKMYNIHVGEKYEWAEINQGNLPDDLLLNTGYKKSFFEQKTVRFSKISTLLQSIIRLSENNGYPFAQIRLAELVVNDSEISATIEYTPGPLISFGSIVVSNADLVKPSFLTAYLGIKSGMAYDERKVKRIPAMMIQLAFLQLVDSPELSFSQGQCDIVMDIKRKKASSFDGIIGFLPNYNEPNKLLITGQAYLHLGNLFKAGKDLRVDWQKPNALTQELSVKYNHPNLLYSPLDLSLQFLLFKQDSSFLNRDFHIGIQYTTFKSGKLGLKFLNESSRLLSTTKIIADQDLMIADFNLNYYGISYLFNTLNDLFFPTRGLSISLDLNFGSKEIINNSGISDELYEGLELKSLQILSQANLSYYTSIKDRHVLKSAIGGGLIENDQLFLNDLFRLGGIYSIRGFNEKEFYASGYLTGSFEYRFMFESQSYLLAFFDGGYYQEKTHNSFREDTPFGIGTGMSLSTKAGNLSLIFALGKSENQPFDINHSKIHIGYSNRF